MRIYTEEVNGELVRIRIEFDPLEVENPLFTPVKEDIVKPKTVSIIDENIKKLNSTLLELYTKSKEEIKSELFEPIKEEIKEEQIEPEVIPEPSIIILEKPIPKDEDHMQILGQWVDEIREKYCGDILPPTPIIDEETGEQLIDKESGELVFEEKIVPKFSIGVLDTVDKYNELLYEVINEKIDEKVDVNVDEEVIKIDEIKEDQLNEKEVIVTKK